MPLTTGQSQTEKSGDQSDYGAAEEHTAECCTGEECGDEPDDCSKDGTERTGPNVERLPGAGHSVGSDAHAVGEERAEDEGDREKNDVLL
jgi:hypothetical protein